MHNVKSISIFVFVFGCFFLHCSTVGSEEKNNQVGTADAEVQTEQSKLRFFVDNLRLSNSLNADEVFTLPVMNIEHAILLHHANGRKKRGDVIFFHAQGENPQHLRLAQPLAQQLAQLGWNIYLPNIAIESYPKIKPQEKKSSNDLTNAKTAELTEANSETNSESKKGGTDTSKNSSSASTTEQNSSSDLANPLTNPNGQEYSFKSFQGYQDYFSELCVSLIRHAKISDDELIVIANQNSAYWSLDCLAQSDNKIPTVFLQPELPLSLKNDLKDKFSQLSNPIFSFQSTQHKKTVFQKAFSAGFWQSETQRFNIGMLPPIQIEIEDLSVAKAITGWIEKQRNNKQTTP